MHYPKSHGKGHFGQSIEHMQKHKDEILSISQNYTKILITEG